MGTIFFVIKCAVVTFFVVLLMQVRVNERTLEQHAVRFIYGSSVMEPLQATASSTAKAVRKGVRSGSKAVSEKWNEIWDQAVDKVDQTADEITE